MWYVKELKFNPHNVTLEKQSNEAFYYKEHTLEKENN